MTSIGRSTISPRYRKWLIESKLLGMDDQQIFQQLGEVGIDSSAIQTELDSLVTHPTFQVAADVSRRLQKLQSFMDIRQELRHIRSKTEIELIRDLSVDDFLDRYYSRNEPVILTNLMSSWQAPAKWTSDYLKAQLGEEVVEIMVRAESEPKKGCIKRCTQQMKFADYVDLVDSVGETNDYYLVGYNRFIERPAAKVLLEDIDFFPGFLDAARQMGRVFFWFGPAGTVTPLHHDTMNIFMAQVRGRKHIKLISPEQTHLLYNSAAVFSEVDCEYPDYDRHPLFKDVEVYDVTLEPGQVLFLPVGWWHHVRALEISISMTFANFLFPNEFPWDEELRALQANKQ